jgi:hypothetical protein
MARLLVCNRNDGRGKGFRPGDVIAVKPDDHKWGRAEGPPNFSHVDIPGAPVSDFAHLVEPELSEEKSPYSGETHRIMKRRRKNRVNLNQLREVKKRTSTPERYELNPRQEHLADFIEERTDGRG